MGAFKLVQNPVYFVPPYKEVRIHGSVHEKPLWSFFWMADPVEKVTKCLHKLQIYMLDICYLLRALQQKVSFYVKWFHWILSEFTDNCCGEQGPMKKQWIMNGD